MKKQIKDLTKEEFETWVCDTTLGRNYEKMLEEAVSGDAPIDIYNGAKLVIHVFEQEIEINE